MGLRHLMVWIVLLLAAPADVAHAADSLPEMKHRYCHAVVPAAPGAGAPAAKAFACGGEPSGYEAARLWLRAAVPGGEFGKDGTMLLVHQTRFDRMVVIFGYADGTHVDHEVRAGAFGSYWRVGGQLAFAAPRREAPLTSVMIGIDGLADYGLLRTRLLAAGSAARDAALGASLVGGALTLLALSACYNLLLARASRRRFVAWHAAWVGTVLIWGLLWSQLALLLFPALAGTATARLCTMLATLAITFAALCAATCPEPGTAPSWARRIVLVLGLAMAALGAPVAFGPPAAIDLIGPLLSLVVLTLLVSVTLLIVLAWRRGSREARSYFLAWAIPMVVLAATELVDMGTSLFGGGPQIAVLLASALQTLWLSVATTLRLAHLRVERDTAQAREAEMRELAQRDPLTGLLNRRGFIQRMQTALAEARGEGGRFALMLIDVDHFKAINDRFGHDSGDTVLQRLSERLTQLAGEPFFAARLGGEEFALGVAGLPRPALAVFAEEVRAQLGALELADLLDAETGFSVSIGLAEVDEATGFQTLYRRADQALYAAKHGGRDRVVCFPPGETGKRGRMAAA